MHPADLFMTLWRRLETRRAAVHALAGRLEADHERSGRLAAQAAERLRDGAAALAHWVPEGDDDAALERALAAAQAIDRWFAPLASWYDTPSSTDHPLASARVEALRRYNRDSRFNADPGDGQLILRPGLLARALNIRETAPPPADSDPFDPVDLFQTLLVVPPSLTIGARHDGDPERRIAVQYHRVAGAADQTPADPDWTPVISVVPLAEAEDDLAIRQFRRDGEDWYDPIPRALGQRAADAIAALAERGATIVLFPEVSVHPDTLVAIKDALRRQAVDGSIRYALVGVKDDGADSEGGRPRNRALLLDRRGEEIARQTKLHCWDLDSDQCRSYDLRDRNGRLLDCAKEDIATGDRFTIVELPDFGRLAVAICEDLGRTEPSAWITSGMMVDWLVTPVMDSGLTTERWQAREGGASSRTGGCRVIVANSMALSHRFNRYCRRNGQEEAIIRDCGVALLFQPRASQSSAPHIACLTLDLEDPSPGHVHARWEPDRWPTLPDPEPEEGSDA
ncbi:nitrilase-related carbon-nitrogen hydrolase [Azospirillum sp. TSO35-2]|uniref:nitrilase-related carbon-nitrogen hydrolase n=1 Tax=Azospirillum sp. TSO35-2 TaxID=716796 RepID=UPI000D61D323|nr:nitrilase-related carbon-nitrogen hydrolase [Azospirillum sp. TSO35-2]PWC36120.1 hypothetical protein TSO352_13255 [Azospirillum sp. TSO35-2]